MSTYWLRKELASTTDAILGGDDTALTLQLPERVEVVYYPDSDEYIISADIIQKAKESGATIVVYPTAWSKPTFEAQKYAKKLNISIMSNAQFFAYLKRKGVKCRR